MASYRVLKLEKNLFFLHAHYKTSEIFNDSTSLDLFRLFFYIHSWLVGGSEEQESVVVTSSHSEEPTGDQFRSRVVTSNFLNLALAEIKERSLEQSKHTHTMHMMGEREEGVEMVEII